MNHKPFFWTRTHESVRDSYKPIYVEFKTYAELKRNIKEHLVEAVELPLSVIRHRRGEWGEWWEHWDLVDGNPKIIEQGWN